jgi:hypothetical protein
MCKSAGLWSHCALMMSAFNVPTTPFGEGKRAFQTRDAVEDWMAVSDPEHDILFNELYPRILEDRGELHKVHEEHHREAVWEHIKHHPMWDTRGETVNMNRLRFVLRACFPSRAWCYSNNKNEREREREKERE